MVIKILIIVFLIAIVYSLVSAFFFMAKDHGKGSRMVNRLSWRIGLSLLIFMFLWGAYKMGWIEPNSGPVRVQPDEQTSEPQ
jgi:hypothetical protein